MGEEADENTCLYLMWVDAVHLCNTSHQDIEVVLRWYVDQANECSEAFVISGANPVNPLYIAFMVVSFEDAAADRSKSLMMTLSEANGSAHLAYQGLDVANLSWDSNFKEEWIELQTENGEPFANVHIHSAMQARTSEDGVAPQAEAVFVKPDVDGQAKALYDYIRQHVGVEEEQADGDDAAQKEEEQERARAQQIAEAESRQREEEKRKEEERERQRKEEDAKRRQDDEGRRKQAEAADREKEEERRTQRERAQRERSHERGVERERELSRRREEKGRSSSQSSSSSSRRSSSQKRKKKKKQKDPSRLDDHDRIRQRGEFDERDRYRRDEDLSFEERKEIERRQWEARREALRQHAKQERLREKDERNFRAQERQRHVEVTASRLHGDGYLSTPRGSVFDTAVSTPHGTAFAGNEHMLNGSRGTTPRQHYSATMPSSEPMYETFSDRGGHRSDHRDHHHVDNIGSHRSSIVSNLGEHHRTHDHAHRQHMDAKRPGGNARHQLAHHDSAHDHHSEGSVANLFDLDEPEHIGHAAEMMDHGRGHRGARAHSHGAHSHRQAVAGSGGAMSSTHAPLSARLEHVIARKKEVDTPRGPWKSEGDGNDIPLVLNDGVHEMEAPPRASHAAKVHHASGRHTGLRNHQAHGHSSHHASNKRNGAPQSAREARGVGSGSPTARSIVAAALNDAITAKAIDVPVVREAPTEAVESGIMRIVQLQKQLQKAGDSPGHAALTEAAAGLVPHMLHILQVAREVSEENRSRLHKGGTAKHSSVKLDTESADHLQAQLDALEKLHSQYALLLPKDGAHSRNASNDNRFCTPRHTADKPSVFHRRLAELDANSSPMRETVHQPNPGQSRFAGMYDHARNNGSSHAHTPVSADLGLKSPSLTDHFPSTPTRRAQFDPGGPPLEAPVLHASGGSTPPRAKFREMREGLRQSDHLQLSVSETLDYLSNKELQSGPPSARVDHERTSRFAAASPNSSDQKFGWATNGSSTPRGYTGMNVSRHGRAGDVPQVPLRMAYQSLQGMTDEFAPPRRLAQQHFSPRGGSKSPERQRQPAKDKYLTILEKLHTSLSKQPYGSKILDGSLSARSPRRGYR